MTRLILVDDHAVVRDALEQLLAAEPDLEVVGTAETGAEGLRLARSAQPDLVLLDISLPDSDGLDLIAPLLEQCPDVRVVMLSMHSEPEYASVASQRGASGLIAKSDSPASFLEALRRVARGGVLAPSLELTPREREILAHVAQGIPNDEIAALLDLQPKTVEGYCQRLMDRLNMHTRVGLMRCARRMGL
jgi:DNA-binding NarL/FixJ family response regulator